MPFEGQPFQNRLINYIHNNHKNIIAKRNGKKVHSKLNEPLCSASTKKGTPCKRKAVGNVKILCSQHYKMLHQGKMLYKCKIPPTNVVVTI